ncbi:GCN5-related N-acetyltransferase protein [Rhizobium etli]|uniref:GCN5-related N-acetyltransferase protein n=1 Tax=Rhizobium etli TaxID=29449 RepID=A0AAN1BGS4_RHIET|nr:GCN5-related N-acetyltransferase protein [Rhizobium etli bv. mimosae str. Mim1]ARQ10217.1 GCN5-related N-acetyltransferase protein [Rhizobium etli]
MIDFRSLTEADFPMLCEWLNKPHMRAHYQKTPITIEEVRRKYSERLSPSHPTYCHIACHDGEPFGKLQCYLLRDYPDFASEMGEHDGVAVDLFIGDEHFIGRGLGKAMLRSYVLNVIPSLFPQDCKCFICHAKENTIAIRGSLSAGFLPYRDVIEGGVESLLLSFDRPN